MPKTVWVSATPWDKKIVTTALESGADAILVAEGDSEKVKQLGVIATVAPDGDIVLGRDVVEVSIASKADEEEAARQAKSRKVIVSCADWTIIPLENLIASGGSVIARVSSAEEARTALQTLERGVDGVLLAASDLAEIKKTVALVKESSETLPLVTAKVTTLRSLGMGDRVCVDTCTTMLPGQGMLAGNSSAAMFLVHAETLENPYVAARPFRVNAGAVHAYTLVPGDKTRYLSELSAGDDVLLVDSAGRTSAAIVGRSKIERRPLMLVEADAAGAPVSLVLQNAETIRLTGPDGSAVSVVELREGSEVLAYVEQAGRHFGMKVEESIVER